MPNVLEIVPALLLVLLAALYFAGCAAPTRNDRSSPAGRTQRERGKKKKKKHCTMPKKNSKQKKQAQKQAERKRANAKAAKAEEAAASAAALLLHEEDGATTQVDVVATPDQNNNNSDAKPGPANHSNSDDESSDEDSDDDLEWMARRMGIKVNNPSKQTTKTAPQQRLHAILEQGQNDPENTLQIPLPLGVLRHILAFIKNDLKIDQVLTTRSLFAFSLAAADSWETAGLKSARAKLNQKAQKALRRKEMDAEGDDQQSCDGASIMSEPVTQGGFDDDYYDDDDGDFSDFYFSAKGHGKVRYKMGGKSNTFKAAKSRAHATMKRMSQRAVTS